jgi:hypothetical protein
MFLLAFVPIQIHILYQRKENKDQIQIKIKLFFITINLAITSPFVKVLALLARRKYNPKNIKESLKAEKLPERNWGVIIRRINIWAPRGIQVLSHSLKLTSKILKPIKCKKLNIYTKVGLGDAAQTSIAFGSLWGIYSFLISQLSKWISIKTETPTIQIIPDFNNPKLHLEYDCIISFPLGHIIIVIIQTIRFVRVSSSLLRGITS